MADMFKKIKKQNGERFAKAIRAYDNGIFDIENLDKIVKYAGREAEPIMEYLVSLKGIEIDEHTVSKTPLQLLDEAGYDAYYADTLEKQNAISHYYADGKTLERLASQKLIDPDYAFNGEKLCTFHDPHRFEKYYIINAVRKDVDDIRREDFPHPEREDKYGTSVLSIQVLKTGGFISIKNRYNHTVKNPDNTLNSNPDKIIEGLSMAIKQHFNVDFSANKNVGLPRNYMMINDQIIKYEREENNIYVGDSFYVKDGVVIELNKDYQEMIEHRFILDKKTGTLKNIMGLDDPFVSVLQNEIMGKKISVSKDKENDRTRILVDGEELLCLEKGKITELHLLETTELPDNFMSKIDLDKLGNIWALKLKRVGNDSFARSHFMMHCPELEEIGNNSFQGILSYYNFDIDMPKIRKIGNKSFTHLRIVKGSFDNLEEIGSDSMSYIGQTSFPKLKKIGDRSCEMVLHGAKTLYAPELEEVGDNVFCVARDIDLYLPKLRSAGHNFLKDFVEKEKELRINLPNLECVGDNFMCRVWGKGVDESDYSLAEFNAPKLKTVGRNFMEECTDIGQMNVPNEINVQVEFSDAEIERFMSKMPSEKRPKPVALEPNFTVYFETENTQENHAEQESHTKIAKNETTPIRENNVSTLPETAPVSEKTQMSKVGSEIKTEKSMGLKNRLFSLSEQRRIEKIWSFAKSLFCKKDR